MKFPKLFDSGQFKATRSVPDIPCTFEPGTMSDDAFNNIMKFNCERDRHLFSDEVFYKFSISLENNA